MGAAVSDAEYALMVAAEDDTDYTGDSWMHALEEDEMLAEMDEIAQMRALHDGPAAGGPRAGGASVVFDAAALEQQLYAEVGYDPNDHGGTMGEDWVNKSGEHGAVDALHPDTFRSGGNSAVAADTWTTSEQIFEEKADMTGQAFTENSDASAFRDADQVSGAQQQQGRKANNKGRRRRPRRGQAKAKVVTAGAAASAFVRAMQRRPLVPLFTAPPVPKARTAARKPRVLAKPCPPTHAAPFRAFSFGRAALLACLDDGVRSALVGASAAARAPKSRGKGGGVPLGHYRSPNGTPHSTPHSTPRAAAKVTKGQYRSPNGTPQAALKVTPSKGGAPLGQYSPPASLVYPHSLAPLKIWG